MKNLLPTPSTSVETAKTKKGGTWRKFLTACALFGALALPLKASTQGQISPEKKDSIECVVPTQTQVLPAEGKKKESNLEVHGSVRAGSNVTPLLGSVLSNTPACRFTIDVSDPKSGFGASVIRFDDFNKSMENPASQLTMIDLYLQKKLGKVSIIGVGEYANIDKIPGSDSFTPMIGASYNAGKGWNLDIWGCYTIQRGEDVAAFRAGVIKEFNDAFLLAAQVIYNEKISGHFQAKVKINKKSSIEIGGIVDENGKITPTAGILIGF